MILKTSKGQEFYVDADWALFIDNASWSLNADGYVQSSTRVGNDTTCEGLHRLIMNAQPGEEVDHIDLDPRNNRRSNLRMCTRSQNLANRRPSKGRRYKGVYTVNNSIKFQVLIFHGGTSRYFGLYATEEEAAHIYDREALKLYGEFARLNFGKNPLVQTNQERRLSELYRFRREHAEGMDHYRQVLDRNKGIGEMNEAS